MAEAEVRLYDPEYAIAAAKRFLSNRNSNLRPEDIAGASGDVASLPVKRGRPSEAIPYLEATTKAMPDIGGFWAECKDQPTPALFCLRCDQPAEWFSDSRSDAP